MPDNIVDIKVIADASTVAPAFDSAKASAQGLIGSFAGVTEKLGPLTTAELAATRQMDLFAISEAKAGEQMALFAESGAVIVPVLEGAADGFSALNVSAAETPGILQSVITWFRGTGDAALMMGHHVREAAFEAQESVVQFAEKTKISSLGITSALGLVSTAFAGIAIVGILGEMLEKVQENSIEAEHFASATGFEVVKLVELKDALTAVGGHADALDANIQRLSKNMQAARVEGTKQAEAFRQLGVDTSRWKEELPPVDEVLQKMAIHLHDSTNNTQDMAAVQAVAGRNVVTLTAFLKGQGEELGKNMELHKKHGEAVEASIPAALRLRAAEAQMGEAFRTVAADILPLVVAGFSFVEIAVRSVSIVVREIIYLFMAAATVGYQTIVGFGKASLAAVKGDFKGAAEIMRATAKQTAETQELYDKIMVEDARESATNIKAAWDRVFGEAPKEPKPSGETNLDPKFSDKDGEKARQKELEGELHHAVAVLELRKKMYQDQEQLGAISASSNLARLINNNNEILTAELSFYDKMAAAAKKDPNSKERLAEIGAQKVAATDKANAAQLALMQHFFASGKKLSEEDEKIQLKYQEAIADGEKRNAAKRLKEFERVYRGEFDEQRKAALQQQGIAEASLKGEEAAMTRKEELYRRDVEFQASLGIISNQKREELVNASFDRESAMQRASLQKQLEALSLYDAQYERKRIELMNRMQALDDRMAEQRRKSEEETIKKVVQNYRGFINSIGSAFQTNIMSWVKGTQTFGQAFRKMGADMLSGWIGTLLQMGVKWAEQKALELALHIAGIEAKESADVTAAGATYSIGAAAAAAEIAQAAAVAAANAYAATAAIPIVGPALAPAAAAEAFSSVIGLEGLAFAEQGALLPANTLAYLHKDEMVLPAQLSKGLQGIIAGGQPNSPAGDSSESHFHFSPVIQAFDSAGVDKVLKDHQRTFIRNMQSWARSGHLGAKN